MDRYIQPAVVDDLQKKMVIIGSPGQAGKTTVALRILEGNEQYSACFNRDYADDRRLLLRGGPPPIIP